MSCNAQALCVAGNDIGNLASSVNPSGGVNAWHVVGPVLGPVTAVECTLPALCMAADKSGALATSNNPTGGTTSWHSQQVDSNALSSISCASQAFCIAVDAGGRALIGAKCLVPNAKGKALTAARNAIRAAYCAVGVVTIPQKPKRKPPKHKRWTLVVGRESPRSGSINPKGTKVRLTMVYEAV